MADVQSISSGRTTLDGDALNRRRERSVKRTHDVLSAQIARLEAKRDSLDAALSFLRGKLEWIDAGKPGDAPRLDDYRC